MSKKPCYILGIESSCDETSAAVLKDDRVLSNIIANQEIHKKFNGVVPELASREHQKNIIPVVIEALNKANIEKRYKCCCLHFWSRFIRFIISWKFFCKIIINWFKNPNNSC